jgi:endonuclease/exonuclease/phosphatase family metal-dependent hydrolase
MALLQRLEGILVLMGDFNFSGIQGELGPIRERLADTYEIAGSGTEIVAKRGTVTGRLPYRLDHIFVDPRYLRVEAVGLTSEAHREASDHFGYYACLEPL